MSNQQLADYIKQCRQAGMPDAQIREALLKTGWLEQDVNEALSLKGIGVESATPTSSRVDSPEVETYIRKWSWGGFAFPWIYYVASRLVKKGLLYLLGSWVPGLNIVLQIITGIKGRRTVWESGKWTDFAFYKERQKVMDVIGFVFIVLMIVGLILAVVSLVQKSPNPIH